MKAYADSSKGVEAGQRLWPGLPLIFVLLLSVCGGANPARAQRGDGMGKRDAALSPCDEAWDRGKRAEAFRCYGALLQSASSLATQAEAAWGLRDPKRANELFQAAVKADPKDPDLRVRWGYLFLQTHNAPGALELFDEALEIDGNHVPAKLGKAAVLADRFEGKAHELVDEAIEAAPDLLRGHILLAQMAIEEKDYKAAEEHLATALRKAEEQKLSPLEIYSLRAALDLMRDNPESEWTKKALAYNPTYGQIYADLAHFYVITRRYREATDMYRKAIVLDPELWSAHADLGVNLLREGKEAEGQKHLEIAYGGDPFSPQTTNTLRLLDSLKNFRDYSNKADVVLGTEEQLTASIDKPEVIVKLHEKEADILRPYVMALAERSIATFSKKYQFTPKEPVKIELYPDHDDFAVRTMGLPGIGLLGVTFGYVVAMDSPSGRRPGTFHWGTTLWHEMAHVFTLEATNHLVPRWYSEGISMYEEWQADPRWGERLSPDLIKAIEEDKLLPIADLDKGFVRPRYPNQVVISYFQAGLVCRMIDETWGFPKLVDLLRGFGEGKETPDNLQAVLGVSAEEFDRQFKAYIQKLTGSLVEGFAEWRKKLREALEAAKEENWTGVIAAAEKARDLYPDYVESGNPYTLLAKAYEESGDKAAALENLAQYEKRGGKDPETVNKLASWLNEAGRRAEAIHVLEGLIYVAPADSEVHGRLGEWYLEEGRNAEALREFNAVLASKPHDLAGAYFNLARTYHKMKDRERTRKHLLASLEAAPSFRPAQKLLLEISK
jgi:tetratricopeptide (TPR) repeat protein